MKAEVIVTLKKGILDPQGKAVADALLTIDGGGVTDVRIGKFIELTIDEADEAKAKEAVAKMCDRLLANPVTEEYKIKIADSGSL